MVNSMTERIQSNYWPLAKSGEQTVDVISYSSSLQLGSFSARGKLKMASHITS